MSYDAKKARPSGRKARWWCVHSCATASSARGSDSVSGTMLGGEPKPPTPGRSGGAARAERGPPEPSDGGGLEVGREQDAADDRDAVARRDQQVERQPLE